ncbi:hypothetical protein Ancab_008029 [Ancistrocladus abbreviatus]
MILEITKASKVTEVSDFDSLVVEAGACLPAVLPTEDFKDMTILIEEDANWAIDYGNGELGCQGSVCRSLDCLETMPNCELLHTPKNLEFCCIQTGQLWK